MKILDQSIFNSIKHRLPINNIKFLSYPNKNLETSSEYFILTLLFLFSVLTNLMCII